jgi:hypothetical protein
LTAVGDGGRVRLTGIRTIVRSGRQLMFRSLDSDEVLESELDLASDRLAGFRLGRVIFSIPGGDAGAAVLVTPVSASLTVADSLHCAPVRDSRM